MLPAAAALGLGRIEALGGDTHATLREGQTVEILTGPFAEHDAVLSGVGVDRVVVLLRVLGSVREVGVVRSQVRAVV